MSEETDSDFLKKIKQLLKKTGVEDSNVLHALNFHLRALLDSNTEDEIETREELCQYLLSKIFLDKMDLYPVQSFKCQLKEYSDWPLSPLPAELFGCKTQENGDKIKLFNSGLKKGDVLDCRVSAVQTEDYELRVIHKYGVTQLLNDIQLMVHLRCTKNEIQILKDRLLVSELVRVAVFDIEAKNDKEKNYVTVDLKNFEESSNFRPMPKLGRITENDVPSYVLAIPDTKQFPSYSAYLISKPQFYNPHFYDGLIERCGIDPKIVCSYFPEYNCMANNGGETGQDLLRKSKLDDAVSLTNSALNCTEKKQYDDSLKFIAEAFEICPSEDPQMSNLYYIRSEIYSEQMNTFYNMKSLCDLELAFNLKSDRDIIKQKFLHQIFKAANCYYRCKQYKKAVIGFEFVLKNDENHRLAARALDKIKTKHSDQLLNFEEMSQIDLQEKKKKLLTELKKLSSVEFKGKKS